MNIPINDENRHFVTGKVILHYPHLQQPYSYKENIPPRYSVTVIIPKDGTENINTIMELKSNIATVAKIGAEKFGDLLDSPNLSKSPLNNGNSLVITDLAYKNSVYFTAYSKIKPNIVNDKLEYVEHDNNYYELRYARVSINIVPYQMKGKLGISLQLENIQVFPETFDVSKNKTDLIADFS